MDKELIKQWIAELRSGNWRQGKTRLAFKTMDGNYKHCCLGVLNEIAGVPFVEGENLSGGGAVVVKQFFDRYGSHGQPVYTFTSNDEYLRDELGIPESVIWEAISMNDRGESFDLIADYLEGELL